MKWFRHLRKRKLETLVAVAMLALLSIYVNLGSPNAGNQKVALKISYAGSQKLTVKDTLNTSFGGARKDIMLPVSALNISNDASQKDTVAPVAVLNTSFDQARKDDVDLTSMVKVTYNETQTDMTASKGASNESSTLPPSYQTSENRTFFWNSTHFRCQTKSQLGSNDTTEFPQFPHLIILGAQKGGTTALYELLKPMSRLVASIGKEPHYWDRLGRDPAQWSDRMRCDQLAKYFKNWDPRKVKPKTATSPTPLLFEKTPKLLAIPRVSRYITEALAPHKPKLIIMLRDPVSRWYSHYQMSWRFSGNRAGFARPEAWMKKSVDRMRDDGLIQAPLYDNNTIEWNSADFGMGANASVLLDHYIDPVRRGMYAQQIRPFLTHKLNVNVKIARYESFKQNQTAVMLELLDFIFDHDPNDGRSAAILKEIDASNLKKDLGPQHTTQEYPPLTDSVRNYLRELYRPFNEDLADLMGESWRGIWD